MLGFLSGLKADARILARSVAFSAAFGTAGVFLVVAGLVSMSAALWIAIAASHGAIMAFVLLGALYFAFGALCLLLATRRPRGAYYRRPLGAAPPPPREPLVQIAEGFAIGMQAGRAARGPRR